MLVAGDKQGQWKRWDDQNIPIADDLFDTHLNKLKQTKQQKGRNADDHTDDWLKKRPVNRDAVDAHKARMRGELRAYALRELREAQGLTQLNWLACCTLAKPRQRPERGEVEHTQVDTLRRYIDALGGQLRIEVDLGDERIQIAERHSGHATQRRSR